MPLATAIRMTDDAVEIAYQYLRDRRYQPSEEELVLIDKLVESLWQNHATAHYIARSLRARSRSKQSGEAPIITND